MPRLRARPPLPRVALRRPSRRAIAGAVLAGALLVPGWLWLRDSPLVSVDKVNVTGVSGPQAAEVRRALVDAAERMTTLDVDQRKLADAVRQFPIVAGVTAKAHLLHTLDIEVTQHVPVGALSHDGKRLAVADDGTILEGTVTKGLPTVPVGMPPGGRTLADAQARRLVALLAAAPAPIRERVERVRTDDERGLVAQLADGPELYFGAATRLFAKWIAAERVLADYTSRGAAYLDLRVPERPAAGGFEATDGTGTVANTQSIVETSQ